MTPRIVTTSRNTQVQWAQNNLYDAAKAGLEFDLDARLDAMILEGANINKLNSRGHGALSIAAQGNSAAWVLALVARGAKLNPGSELEACYPLNEAIFRHSTECVKALIDAGSDLGLVPVYMNISKNIKSSALHQAAKFACGQMIGLLISGGAKINLRDSLNVSVIGAASPSIGMIKTLVDHGANIESVEPGGNRFVHRFLRPINPHVADINVDFFVYLLSLDVDLLTPNDIGEVPLQMAKRLPQFQPVLAAHLARQAACEALGEPSVRVKLTPAG